MPLNKETKTNDQNDLTCSNCLSLNHQSHPIPNNHDQVQGTRTNQPTNQPATIISSAVQHQVTRIVKLPIHPWSSQITKITQLQITIMFPNQVQKRLNLRLPNQRDQNHPAWDFSFYLLDEFKGPKSLSFRLLILSTRSVQVAKITQLEVSHFIYQISSSGQNHPTWGFSFYLPDQFKWPKSPNLRLLILSTRSVQVAKIT